jgi:hypothetical protein
MNSGTTRELVVLWGSTMLKILTKVSPIVHFEYASENLRYGVFQKP